LEAHPDKKLILCVRATFLNSGLGIPELSKEQWIGVLRLSRLWDMPEVGQNQDLIDISVLPTVLSNIGRGSSN
jgi:hypothetical protein